MTQPDSASSFPKVIAEKRWQLILLEVSETIKLFGDIFITLFRTLPGIIQTV